MTSNTAKSEVGISPVLLQAISHTLSTTRAGSPTVLTPKTVVSGTPVLSTALPVCSSSLPSISTTSSIYHISPLNQSFYISQAHQPVRVSSTSSDNNASPENVTSVPLIQGEFSFSDNGQQKSVLHTSLDIRSGLLETHNVLPTLSAVSDSQTSATFSTTVSSTSTIKTSETSFKRCATEAGLYDPTLQDKLTRTGRIAIVEPSFEQQVIFSGDKSDENIVISYVDKSKLSNNSSPNSLVLKTIENVLAADGRAIVGDASNLPVEKIKTFVSSNSIIDVKDVHSLPLEAGATSTLHVMSGFSTQSAAETIVYTSGINSSLGGYSIVAVDNSSVPVTNNNAPEIGQPCPICMDKVSGYHYGIYSCESCKGFFKRTVQNKKTFVCHKSGDCEVNMQNRKKCPACRFKRCMDLGMKLEAIRVDRTRGGRSSYEGCSPHGRYKTPEEKINEKKRRIIKPRPSFRTSLSSFMLADGRFQPINPQILEELMVVESLLADDDLEPACCLGKLRDGDGEVFNSTLHLIDHCLYKIVRWSRNLPDFANIPTDDQILLLQNCWAELLCLHASYRSMNGPADQISLPHGRFIDLGVAKSIGMADVVQRLLDFTAFLREYEVDRYEILALKVLLLLTPDVRGLKNSHFLISYQDKIMDALLLYTLSHYPTHSDKITQLTSRLAEISRTAIIGKEVLTARQADGEIPVYSLLSELLKGDVIVQGDQAEFIDGDTVSSPTAEIGQEIQGDISTLTVISSGTILPADSIASETVSNS